MMPMPPGMPARPTYEFSDLENATLSSTAKYARWWGVIAIVTGVLLVLGAGVLLVALEALTSSLSRPSGFGLSKGALLGVAVATIAPLGIVHAVCGVFYLQTGNALQQVVDTQGDDMPLCLRAVQSLSRAFMVEAVSTGIAFLVGVVAGIVGLGVKS